LVVGRGRQRRQEGGPMVFNFYWVLQQQNRGSPDPIRRKGARPGEGISVGQGCVVAHGRLRASDSGSEYSYYGGC
jgi:hypothetical protein